jgi:Rps23 Pro-64 3,4-dihydroxylase Tpa1-like proline 4-hydroxylase
MTSLIANSSRRDPSSGTETPDSGPAGGLLPSQVLEWSRLQEIAAARAEGYSRATPFPHIMLDGLFEEALLDQAVEELPTVARWARYDTANERKVVCSDVSAFGPAGQTLVHALNSAPFIRFLERLTGIPGLIPDPHLHAAGYMKVAPGGFLGLHYDFSTQQELRLDRRVNVLLYLNRDWHADWGGQLELHSNDPLESAAHTTVEIEPLFNRLVIFNTPEALHGHRRPIACPPERARLCLSWYYDTAPPVPGWALRMRKVRFLGRRDPVRTAIKAANLLTPPIAMMLAQSVRTAWKSRPEHRTRQSPP